LTVDRISDEVYTAKTGKSTFAGPPRCYRLHASDREQYVNTWASAKEYLRGRVLRRNGQQTEARSLYKFRQPRYPVSATPEELASQQALFADSSKIVISEITRADKETGSVSKTLLISTPESDATLEVKDWKQAMRVTHPRFTPQQVVKPKKFPVTCGIWRPDPRRGKAKGSTSAEQSSVAGASKTKSGVDSVPNENGVRGEGATEETDRSKDGAASQQSPSVSGVASQSEAWGTGYMRDGNFRSY
jgi:hypothetical protein